MGHGTKHSIARQRTTPSFINLVLSWTVYVILASSGWGSAERGWIAELAEFIVITADVACVA